MGVHQANMVWTEEKTAELLRLRFQERWTDSRLAKHFDTTRSVIAGKLHRERIKRGHVPKKRPGLGQRRAMPEITATPSLAPMPKSRHSLPPEPEIKFELITKGTGEPCTLSDLAGCKWPIGEVEGIKGRHIFCNAPRPNDPRQPYCDHHKALAGDKYRFWTREEDIKIKTEWRRGAGRNLLAQVLYRTRAAVSMRARQLGLPGGL